MKIEKCVNGSTLTVLVDGRINSATSKEFNAAFEDIDQIDRIDLDFAKLEYISSAGLRVLLAVEKAMRAKSGRLVLHNVSEEVLDTFELTGFTDLLIIQ